MHVKFNGQDFFNHMVFCPNEKIYKKVFFTSIIFWIILFKCHIICLKKLINCVALAKSVIIVV